MPKYAIVGTANFGYIPAINAALNSLKYYGNDVEFHLLFWGVEFEPYIRSVRKNGFYPELVAVDLMSYAKELGNLRAQTNELYALKHIRQQYCIDRLFDYDAVLILDADTVILNNIMWVFDVAYYTKRLVATRYSLHTPELPYVASPMFFKPSEYADVFGKVNDVLDSDIPFSGSMASLNYLLVQRPDIRPIVLPNLLWGATAWLNGGEQSVPITVCNLDGRCYLIAYGEDKMNMLHARWWVKGTVKQSLPEAPSETSFAYQQVRLFWETYYFFNNNCYHSIEWNTEAWGDLDMWDSIGKGAAYSASFLDCVEV